MKILFATTIALTLLGGSIAFLPQPAKANPQKMTVFGDEGYFFLMAQEEDTTLSAYGGRLRLYDVHIAKLFESTSYYCKNTSSSNIYRWKYTAAGQSMGEFHISCQLASDIVAAYGLGKPEETKSMARPVYIPTLNITGGKIDKWMKFTQNFKPVR